MRPSSRLLGLSLFVLPAYFGCATSERIGPVGLGDSGFGDNGGQTLPTGTGGDVASGGFTSTGGQAATGGVTGTGGAMGSGGVLGTGGALGSGGAATGGVVGSGGTPDGSAGATGNSCPDSTQKMCNGACVTPSPSVGCDLTSCTACPAGPTNGFPECTNGACGFGCFSGFVASGSSCVTPPASCTNDKKDGSETDVDCGGSCPVCADGKTCKAATDCENGVCGGTGTKTCSAPTCGDGVQNGNETDVDCGGGAPCSPCPTGDACKMNGDCANGPCTANVCACTPATMATVCTSDRCGSISDGCTGAIDCGTANCTGGQTCTTDGVCACGTPPTVNVDASQYSSKFPTSPVWNCNAAGTTTIDSAAGTITSTSCALGTLDFTNDVVQLDASGPNVMVVRLRGLTVSGGHVLKLVGDKPIVFLVSGNVLVDSGGTIDASATGATAGPGGSIAAQCGGQTGNLGANGGSGAGFGTAGGCGGNKTTGCGAVAGSVSTDADLQPLRGGCSGGDGTTGKAGAGGGAVEISASGTITIGTGSNAGIITAGGGGGQPAITTNNTGGGGGGSGGGILLVSPATASFGSAGAARVHGGGGGEGKDQNDGHVGADGHPGDNTPAAGGNGGSAGGDGGDGGLCAGNNCSVVSTSGLPGVSRNTGGNGGGGGGGGRVQVITSAAVCI